VKGLNMPRKCTVCDHPHRAEIDAAIVEGTSLRVVAGHASLSFAAMQRHAKAHLPPAIVKAAEVKAEILEVARAETLLDQVKALQIRALELLDQAEASGEIRNALAGVRECRGILELLGRVTRELGPQTAVGVAVVTQPPDTNWAEQLGRLSMADLKELERLHAVMTGELPPTAATGPNLRDRMRVAQGRRTNEQR